MIWIVALCVIGFFTFKQLIFEDGVFGDGAPESFLGWCFTLFVGVFLTFMISLPVLGLALWIGSSAPRIGVLDKTYNLVALREKDGFEGHAYFLGVGTVSSTEYYFWYRNEGGGVITGGKTYRDPCVDIYEDNSTPRMLTFKTQYTGNGAAMAFFGIDGRGDESWCEQFYLPPNTIQNGYQL